MTSPCRPSRATTAQRHHGRRRGRAAWALLAGAALTLAGCAGTSEPGATGSATTPHATAATTATTATTPSPSQSTSAPATAVPSTIATPADGATADIVRDCRAGWVADCADPKQIVDTLRQAIREITRPGYEFSPDWEKIRQFSRSNQAQRLATFLNQLSDPTDVN